MGKTFVIAGTDYRQVIGTRGSVREKIGHFETGLAMALELPRRAEHKGVLELAVLEVRVAETGRRMLAVQFVQQRFGIERIHLARAALHEQMNHALGRSRPRGTLRRERIDGLGGCVALREIERGKPAKAKARGLEKVAA
jgi:hypothetical protein